MGSQKSLKTSLRGGGGVQGPSTLPLDPPLLNHGVIEMVMLVLYTNEVIQSCVLLTSNKIAVS